MLDIIHQRQHVGFLAYHHHETTTGTEVLAIGYGLLSDRPTTIAIIGKDCCGAILRQEIEGHLESLLFVCAIDTCYIPCRTITTRKNNTLTRIATDKARLIPYVRQIRQEVLHRLGL